MRKTGRMRNECNEKEGLINDVPGGVHRLINHNISTSDNTNTLHLHLSFLCILTYAPSSTIFSSSFYTFPPSITVLHLFLKVYTDFLHPMQDIHHTHSSSNAFSIVLFYIFPHVLCLIFCPLLLISFYKCTHTSALLSKSKCNALMMMMMNQIQYNRYY